MFGSKKKDTSQKAEKKTSFFDRGIAALREKKDQITGAVKKMEEDKEKAPGVVIPKGGANKKGEKKSPQKDTHFAIGGFGSDDEDEDENIAVKD